MWSIETCFRLVPLPSMLNEYFCAKKLIERCHINFIFLHTFKWHRFLHIVLGQCWSSCFLWCQDFWYELGQWCWIFDFRFKWITCDLMYLWKFHWITVYMPVRRAQISVMESRRSSEGSCMFLAQKSQKFYWMNN